MGNSFQWVNNLIKKMKTLNKYSYDYILQGIKPNKYLE